MLLSLQMNSVPILYVCSQITKQTKAASHDSLSKKNI